MEKLNLLLADDDADDCDFFEDILNELSLPVNLSLVHNGVDLMTVLLSERERYPDLIFLDLNMPRKSGVDCISEIKAIDKLKHIPIVIFSTSLDMDVVTSLYEKGANYYIKKPGQFSDLKKVIKDAIALFINKEIPKPALQDFILQP